MASITIMNGHKNLVFAALVASETGATFAESEHYIAITDSPELVIPRHCADQAFNANDRAALDQIWRSLLANRDGHLVSFTDFEIIISDDPPQEKRPAFLLRFPDAGEKALAEEWAERMGFGSLTQYILDAITDYNQKWREHAGYEDRRAEESA